MTYSRPQTSTVDAFSTPARPNEPVAAPRQIVNTGQSGNLRVVDLGDGPVPVAAQLKGFFDQILTTAPKILEPASIQRANRQVGALLDNVDMQGALRKGDQAALGMVKRLSPRAQDQLQSGMAAVATQDYVESTARNAAIEPLLLNGKSDAESDEQYATRLAKGKASVRAKALAESGVMNLPPEYRGEQALKAQQGESLVYNGIRRSHDEQYNQYWNAKQSELYAVESLNLSRARTLILSSPNPADSEAALVAQNQYGKQFYESVKDKATPTQVAQMMFSGIKQNYERLVSEERFQEAQAYLNFQETLAQQKIETPAGGSLYDIPVTKDNSTLRSAIAQLQAGMLPQIERQKAQENFLAIKPLIAGMLQRDPDSYARFAQMLPAMVQSPEQLGQLLAARSSILAASAPLPASPAQERRMVEIRLAQSREGADMRGINATVAGDTLLTEEQKLRLISDEKPKNDPVMGSVARAREYNAPQIQATTQALVEAAVKKDPAIAASKDGLQAEVRRIGSNVIVTATQNTETVLRRLAEAGKPVTADVANDVFRNELDAVRAAEIKRLGGAAPQRPSVQQERMQEMNYVQQQLRRNGGRPTLSVFPPTVVDAARKNGVPTNDAREMTKFYLKRLGGTLESDGKTKLFPDPGKVWRDMIKQAKPTGSNQSSSVSAPVEKMSSVIQRFVLGGDTSPAPTPEKRGGAGSQPGGALQLAARLGEGLLGGALNVIAPPAMAAGQSGQLQNADQMPRLAAAFRNANQSKQPMSLRDGPLPQIAAAAPVRPLPLAITTDRHPWFVAIGINEGTRTANGGYTKNYFGHTDPGDGNRNVGTVSGGGGRGGGESPQVVDRIWAGRLTNQAMAAAPILMANGISRDTAGFHRVMFNYLDLHVQSPAASGSFMQRLSQMMKGGLTIEAIAKARADSFYYPDGRWGGAWPYPRMLQDQRSRAGAFDYKKRI